MPTTTATQSCCARAHLCYPVDPLLSRRSSKHPLNPRISLKLPQQTNRRLNNVTQSVAVAIGKHARLFTPSFAMLTR